MMTGVNMVHVPYRGAAPALTDLLGGQVQVLFDAVPSSIEHIRTDNFGPWRCRLRCVRKRYRTFRPWEILYLDTDSSGWVGVGAPKNSVDVRKILSVHTRCALVGAALGVGMCQDVLTADLVVQGVEATAGFCLRFRVQRHLQFLNTLRIN